MTLTSSESTPAEAAFPAGDAPIARTIHLRAGGVSLLLDIPQSDLPAICHWGPDLGDLSAADVQAVIEQTARPQDSGPP